MSKSGTRKSKVLFAQHTKNDKVSVQTVMFLTCLDIPVYSFWDTHYILIQRVEPPKKDWDGVTTRLVLPTTVRSDADAIRYAITRHDEALVKGSSIQPAYVDEPTPSMVSAGYNAWDCLPSGTLITEGLVAVYKAMVAAR